MKDSKLLQTLTALSQAEIKDFHHFLSCKLFNNREDPIRLLEYLRAEMKSPKPNLDREFVFKQLFPDRVYKPRRIRNIMSFLSGPLDHFLAFKKLHIQREDELIALCTSLRERNLQKRLETTINKASKAQKHSQWRDSEYHYRNYRLEQERYHASTEKGRADGTNLAEVAKSLDVSYFTNRLRQSCYMLSHQNMYNVTYNLTVVDHILKEVKQHDLLEIPAISIYYYCYLAQAHPENVAYFKSFRQLLITNAALFTISEQKDMYLLALNIAIKRFNQGHRDIVSDMLELYQSGIDQKTLLTNNVLSRFTYKNIVALAVSQKRFDWAESFLTDYTQLLEEDYREITYQYNLAKIYCEKREFDAALQLLVLTNTNDDAYINIDTKILLARIYHEQNKLDAQQALLESFKKILNRKKEILGYQFNAYKNFLHCMNKLTMLNPFVQEARSSLLKKIEMTQPLPDKQWFVKQLS